MSFTVKRSLSVFIAIFSAPIITSSALADSLEEVVVTASPFAKTVEAVQHPVNLLTAEALQHAAASTLGETLNREPGVASASFGPGVGLPVIRGQSDNRVKVMQDSVGSMDASSASPDHAITLEPLLADKIEVLRGPAALRYGSGAIGGVVNVLDNRIPTRLPAATEGGVELRNASANDENVAVATLSTAVNQLGLYADGLKRSSGDLEIPGFAAPESPTAGTLANTSAEASSGSAGASYIGEKGFWGVSVNRLNNNYGVPVDPAEEENVRIDMHQTRYDMKGEINDVSPLISKIAARLGHNRYQHTEMEDGEAGTQFTNDAYEGRLEMLHSPLANWQGGLGVQLAESDFAAIGEEAFIPASHIRSTGLFLVEETSIEHWDYEWGARIDRQSIQPDNRESWHHHSANFSGAARWHFTDTQQLSLGLARSQRAPSLEELAADGPHPATASFLIGDEFLKEETSKNIDLGYHWHSEKVQWNNNIFINQIGNFIYAKNTGEKWEDFDISHYTQADATFKGFESELNIAVTPLWHWRLFSDQVRATLDEGGNLPRITPSRLGTALRYVRQPWDAEISVIHASRQRDLAEQETPTQGYERIDARLNWQLTANKLDYTVFIKANNLTDAEIRNASSYLKDIAPEAGRNLQLGMRLEF